jgi:hypothetical protein
MRRLVTVLPLLLVVVACGGGDEDAAATATPTCPVDATEVVDATGLELDGAVRTTGYDGDISCSFDAADGVSGVSLTTWRDPDGEIVGDLVDGVPGAEVVEIGFDEAVWSSTLTTLYARSGERVVTIAIVDVGEVVGDPLRAATDLAELALG